jgi:hypothetical protein
VGVAGDVSELAEALNDILKIQNKIKRGIQRCAFGKRKLQMRFKAKSCYGRHPGQFSRFHHEIQVSQITRFCHICVIFTLPHWAGILHAVAEGRA